MRQTIRKSTAPILLFILSALAPAAPAAEGSGLFWAIESGSGHAGYLLGTIHSEDPRVLSYTDEFLSALNGSSAFAMELVPDLPTLAKLAERMNLAGGETLPAIIGSDRFQAVADALASYGIPRDMAAQMKPWAAMITLSVPAPKTGLFMDFSLSLRASGNGLKVIGLETLDEQLSFLEDMPLPHQLEMLDQAVKDFPKVGDIHAEMIETYLEGDLAALQAFTEEHLSELGEAGDYFVAAGIEARNLRMADRLIEALRTGTVFAAVGALHLPGEQGLVSLLRKQGYRVVTMAPPFPNDPE